MKVILHGLLAERCGGHEHFIRTNVPADAIEGLSRQLPGWPQDMAIDVIGYSSLEELQASTDDDELHLMPAMFGGGGVVKIIIGAALIAIAVFVPGIGTAISAALISLGASMALMGISELLMKAPTTDKANDPPPSKYLGINRNTVAIGTPIILAWGRNKLGGHWLSIQADSNQLVTTSFPATTS
jgi:predicted phage tail protein